MSGIDEPVADAGFVDDLRAGGAEFAAEVADVDAEGLALVGELGWPDPADDLAESDDAAGVFGEGVEEGEFGGGELEAIAGEGGFVVEEIECQGSGGDFGVLAGEAAALDDGEPGEEFCGAEGFGDVVVGSGFEGFDLEGFLVADAEDEDGDLAPFAETFEDGEPVHGWEAEVEEDGVGAEEGDVLKAGGTVFGFVDLVVAGFEDHGEETADLRFIVDDDDLVHGERGAAWAGRRMVKQAPPSG